MERDPRVVAITAAMLEGTGLIKCQQRFPDRFFDVGIAEQHAVTFAAGLACEGLRPVVAIYSTFLQRAYDQIIHDVALQHLPVVFALDRGGLVGADGTTHQGAFDLSYLRLIPNLVVMAPSDENELRIALATAAAPRRAGGLPLPARLGGGAAARPGAGAAPRSARPGCCAARRASPTCSSSPPARRPTPRWPPPRRSPSRGSRPRWSTPAS